MNTSISTCKKAKGLWIQHQPKCSTKEARRLAMNDIHCNEPYNYVYHERIILQSSKRLTNEAL